MSFLASGSVCRECAKCAMGIFASGGLIRRSAEAAMRPFASGGVLYSAAKVAGACCLCGALIAEPVLEVVLQKQEFVCVHVEQVHVSEGTSADTMKPAEPFTEPMSGGTSVANAFLLPRHLASGT